MIGWLHPAPALRRLLPDQRRRPAPWIVGLMTFVTMIVGAVGLMVLDAATSLRQASADRWLLQVTGTPAEAARAMSHVNRHSQVRAVVPVPERDVRETLSQWLGPAAETLDLPLPFLAEVTLAAGADGPAITRSVNAVVPSARLSSYGDDLAPLLRSLRALSWLVIGLLLVLTAALAAAVTLAARATLEANRHTLEVLHGIGATDSQLLALVQRRIALDALVGGVTGGTAAALILLLALAPAQTLIGQFGSKGLLGLTDLLLLASLPIVLAILATLIARRALTQSLAASL